MMLETLITSITVIQECVDEATEEQYMLYQQELEDESPLVQ